MPRDRLLYPMDQVIPTTDPVEMAKRFLDNKDTKYECRYNATDDCYCIFITQRRPLTDTLAFQIRSLGFSATGKRRFYYRRYSVIAQNSQRAEPIWGDGNFDAQPLRPAPDPYFTPDDV